MKEQFDRNNKIKVIVMGIASVVIVGAAITMFFVNKVEDKPTNSNKTNTTVPKKDDTNYVEAISIDNPDYGENNNSKAVYYVPGLIIYEDNLYADLGSSELVDDLRKDAVKINNADAYLLKEGITKAFIVAEGDNGYHYAFAINKDGDLYYINNFKESSSKKLEVTKVTEFKNIEDIQAAQGSGKVAVDAIGIDVDGEEHILNDVITKYAKLK